MGSIKDIGRLAKRKIEYGALLSKELGRSKYFCGGGTAVTNVLLLCHALEKGMGISNVRLGYGKEKAKDLITYLCQINNESDFAYKEGRAVLDAYLTYQKENKVDISDIEEMMLDNGISLEYPDSFHGGTKWIVKEEFLKGKNVDFNAFVSSRHSIRAFSKETISPNDLMQAIEIAAQAPSACNRQPSKFFYTLDIEKNKQLSRLIPGNRAFQDDIPYYGLVVSERSAFTTPEAFQWYVNGGIFISYLTLAMHSLGIGTCIFQWPDFYIEDDNAKKLCGIKDEDIIVAAIGYGLYPESAKIIMAQRKSAEDLSSQF